MKKSNAMYLTAFSEFGKLTIKIRNSDFENLYGNKQDTPQRLDVK